MGIKKLKKENEILNLNLAGMLERFDTTKTKKYTQFLVKMVNKRIESWQVEQDDFQPVIRSDYQELINRVVPLNSYDNTLSRVLLCDFIFSWTKMERFIEFTELMERGLINEKDISKYDSWDMLEEQLYEAKNRELFKRSKKEIHKIFEDDNYMIFKPLTYAASCSYGYQTKWCTAMINDPGYFYNHSRGILIYLIDKKENKKFAFFKHMPQPYEYSESHEDYLFKTYNQEDKQIDTIQTGLPMNILQIILMECDLKSPTTVPNYKLFSEDEKNEMRKHTGRLPEDDVNGMEEIMEIKEEIRPIAQRLRRREPGILIPIPTRVIQVEDLVGSIMEEKDTKEYLEEAKSSIGICGEELEKQIEEHTLINKGYERES